MTPTPVPPIIGSEPCTRIRYSLTRWDIFRWQLYAVVRNRLNYAIYLISWLGMLCVVWSEPETKPLPPGFKIFSAIFVAIIMFFFLALVMTLVTLAMVVSGKYRGVLGEHELVIQENGLLERTALNESLSHWTGFDRIVKKSGYLYIYVTDTNAHVVPRHSFSSEADYKSFQSELERRVSAAKTTT